jgi:hypothetical protein
MKQIMSNNCSVRYDQMDEEAPEFVEYVIF